MILRHLVLHNTAHGYRCVVLTAFFLLPVPHILRRLHNLPQNTGIIQPFSKLRHQGRALLVAFVYERIPRQRRRFLMIKRIRQNLQGATNGLRLFHRLCLTLGIMVAERQICCSFVNISPCLSAVNFIVSFQVGCGLSKHHTHFPIVQMLPCGADL